MEYRIWIVVGVNITAVILLVVNAKLLMKCKRNSMEARTLLDGCRNTLDEAKRLAKLHEKGEEWKQSE